MEPILNTGKGLRVLHFLSMLSLHSNLDGRATEKCFADMRQCLKVRNPKIIRWKSTCGFLFSQKPLDAISHHWPVSGAFHFPLKQLHTFMLLFKLVSCRMTK